MFLVVCKESDTVRYFDTLAEVAAFLEVESWEVHERLKGTGRYDTADRSFVVLTTLPEEED